jgi:hypothetical protein
MCTQKRNCPGFSPNFPIHVSVSQLYIPIHSQNLMALFAQKWLAASAETETAKFLYGWDAA